MYNSKVLESQDEWEHKLSCVGKVCVKFECWSALSVENRQPRPEQAANM